MEMKRLSDLEQEVMGIIWTACPCSIKEIKTILDTKKKLAYTTVATIVQRLEQKGMLKRASECEGDCNCIKYEAKLSKKEYTKILAQSFLHNFQKSFGDIAITSFADSISGLSKEKRDYFLKLLTKNENK